MPRSLARRTAAACLTGVGTLVGLAGVLLLSLMLMPDMDTGGNRFRVQDALVGCAAVAAGIVLVVLGTRLVPSRYVAPKGGW